MAMQVPMKAEILAGVVTLAQRLRASVVEVRAHASAVGAGTIWRSDGTILTNHHVVPRDQAEVIISDGRAAAAMVIARDPDNDLAALKIDLDHLAAPEVRDARTLRVGELVLAIGHPYGMRGAVTLGVVSKPVGSMDGRGGRALVVADVLLGPGNSGGPLADAQGRVVGINAMVAGGLGLAVPSHLVERLLATQEGSPRDGSRGVPQEAPPVLGIAGYEVAIPPQLAARTRGKSPRGVLVAAVTPSSPAERAGVIVGDVLVALDTQPLPSVVALGQALAAHPGGVARLEVLRGGIAVDLVVHLTRVQQKAA